MAAATPRYEENSLPLGGGTPTEGRVVKKFSITFPYFLYMNKPAPLEECYCKRSQ